MITAAVGPGHSVLDLSFRPDGWDGAGVAITVVSVLALGGWSLRCRLAGKEREGVAEAA
jgi:hypothetical protein